MSACINWPCALLAGHVGPCSTDVALRRAEAYLPVLDAAMDRLSGSRMAPESKAGYASRSTPQQPSNPRASMERTEQNAPASRAAGVAGHTPLPWRWAVEEQHYITSEDGRIANVLYPRYPGNDAAGAFAEVSANAELICLAVNSHADLLAALEGLLADVDNPASDTEPESHMRARAALSKARGLQEKQK